MLSLLFQTSFPFFPSNGKIRAFFLKIEFNWVTAVYEFYFNFNLFQGGLVLSAVKMNGNCLNIEIRDAISRIRFAPQSNNLLISSWDSVSDFDVVNISIFWIRCYEITYFSSYLTIFGVFIFRLFDYMMWIALNLGQKLH